VRSGLWVIVLLTAAACQQNRQPLSVTDRATVAACTARANQVYDRLNRGTIYSSMPQTGLPSSSTGLMGDPTAGLTQRYAYDDMVNRCIRQTGTGAEPGQPGIKGSPVR
jgi:hypothetical protein